MILVVDVFYYQGSAKCVAGVFESWDSRCFKKIYEINVGDFDDYVPGEFFRRELPCIMQLLEVVKEQYDYILVDGYVFLGFIKKPGLGKYLWDNLCVKKPIIGVAKNYFKETPEEYFIFRGRSKKPLYITAIDIPLNVAKENIAKMYGEYRIPDLIKKIDLETRS